MIDTVLDFAVDHAAIFASVLAVVGLSAGGFGVWAYGRYHERATRQRGGRVIG